MAGGALRLLAAAALWMVACGGEKRAEVLSFWALGREGEAVEQVLTAFRKSHPELRLEVQQIPFSAAHEKLLTAIVGRSTPDVAQVGNTWIPELVALGALEPLDAWLPRFPAIREQDHFPGILATNRMQGHLWGIPWYVDTRLLFYRKDLLERAGVLHPPRDWEEWLFSMRRLKESQVAPYACYLPLDDWVPLVVFTWQQGGELVTEEGKPCFCEPAFRRALAFYVRLFRETLAPLAGTAQVGNYYQRFADGWFAMYLTGPWNLGEFRRRLPQELEAAWDTAPLPAPPGQPYPGVSLAGGSSLVVFRTSPHKEQSLRLLAYLSEPQVQVAFYQATGDLPAHRGAWEDPLLKADPKLAAFRSQLEHVRPLPLFPENERIVQHLWEVAEAAVRGLASEEEVCRKLDQDVAAMLAKRRWLLGRTR